MLLFPSTVSAFTLSAMTTERYIGVFYPFTYLELVTKRRLLIYVGAWTLVCLGITITSFRFPHVAGTSLPGLVLLNFLFMVYAYTKIYVFVSRLDRSRAKPADVARDLSRKRHLLREIKHAKSCFIAVVCFAFCLLPSGVSLVVSKLNNTQDMTAAVMTWAVNLVNFNSCCNSLVFFWTKTLMRKEAKIVFELDSLRTNFIPSPTNLKILLCVRHKKNALLTNGPFTFKTICFVYFGITRGELIPS